MKYIFVYKLKKLLPRNTDIEVLENSGHLLICDNPVGLNDLVIKILERNNILPSKSVKQNASKLNILLNDKYELNTNQDETQEKENGKVYESEIENIP
jgi:hypothetical protein